MPHSLYHVQLQKQRNWVHEFQSDTSCKWKKIYGLQVWSQVGRHRGWGKPECIWSNQSSQQLHSLHRNMARICQKPVTVLHGEWIHKSFSSSNRSTGILYGQHRLLWMQEKAGHLNCCLSSRTMSRISRFCWHSNIVTRDQPHCAQRGMQTVTGLTV